MIYNEGFACRRNPQKSLEYFLKAAEMGNCEGMYGVARTYAYDNSANVEYVLEWYEKSSNGGSYRATVELAHTYLNSNGQALIKNVRFFREASPQKALSLYKKAIEQVKKANMTDLEEICYRVSSDIFSSYVLDKSLINFAEECCKQAVALGHKKARRLLSELYLNYYLYAERTFNHSWWDNVSIDDLDFREYLPNVVDSFSSDLDDKIKEDYYSIDETIYWLKRSLEMCYTDDNDLKIELYIFRIELYIILGSIYRYGLGGIKKDEEKAIQYVKYKKDEENKLIKEMKIEEGQFKEE